MAEERRQYHSDRGSGRHDQERRGPGRSKDHGDRVMYDVECEKCHAEFRLPFQPAPGRRVLCRDCMNAERDRDDRHERGFAWDRGERSGERGNDRRSEHRHSRGDAREQAQYDIVCSHCGCADTVPFRPYEGSVVLCHKCMNDPNVERVGGKIMHTIICARCGKKNTVPFKPEPGSRVLCRECHFEEREEKQRAREYYAKNHPNIANRTQVSVEITCAKCGCRDTLPFNPKTHGDILCRQCGEQLFGEEWARRNRVGAREYPFTCARCGAQGFVPFKPKDDEELLCRHCLNDEAFIRHHEAPAVQTNAGVRIRATRNRPAEPDVPETNADSMATDGTPVLDTPETNAARTDAADAPVTDK